MINWVWAGSERRVQDDFKFSGLCKYVGDVYNVTLNVVGGTVWVGSM